MTGQPEPMDAAAKEKAKRSVLRAFWHRSRKVWVPLTKGDVALRVGVTEDVALSLLIALQSAGLVVRTGARTGAVEGVYALTDKGKGAFVPKGSRG